MPLRLFKTLLAQTKEHVLMKQLAARILMEATIAALLLTPIVVKTGLTVAPKQCLAVD